MLVGESTRSNLAGIHDDHSTMKAGCLPYTADLSALAEDEIWLAPHVDRLLLHVVEAIPSVGFPLPGARSFLERVVPPQEPEIWTARGDTYLVLGTSWIQDADSGRSYQWRVRREADRLHLSRRPFYRNGPLRRAVCFSRRSPTRRNNFRKRSAASVLNTAPGADPILSRNRRAGRVLLNVRPASENATS